MNDSDMVAYLLHFWTEGKQTNDELEGRYNVAMVIVTLDVPLLASHKHSINDAFEP